MLSEAHGELAGMLSRGSGLRGLTSELHSLTGELENPPLKFPSLLSELCSLPSVGAVLRSGKVSLPSVGKTLPSGGEVLLKGEHSLGP